jgi:predicted aspartyl protease
MREDEMSSKWMIGLMGALALASAATAQPRAPLDSLFEAAERGEIATLERALASERDDSVRHLLAARIAAARGDMRPSADPRIRAIAEGRDPVQRRAALSILVTAAFDAGDYARAASDGRALLAASGDETEPEVRESMARGVELATIMTGHPPQRIEGAVAAGSIAARVDRVGLPRIDVSINGTAQEAVFDTGAALSVLSAETARRLGVRVLDGQASVGNGVQGSVPVRIGFADRLEIAGTILRDVPFLIIDDAQLTFPVPGGYDIRAIVGLPMMRALGRVRMAPDRFSVLPNADGPAGPPNLSSSGNDLYLDMLIDGQLVPMFVDTGANSSSLSARWAAANAARVAGFRTGRYDAASAGGSVSRQIANWINAPISVAGRSLVLPRLTVSLPGEGRPRRDYGTVGEDVLRAFQHYTIDFRTMRLELGEPVAPRPAS